MADDSAAHHRTHNIPTWDGHPSYWTRYQESVRIWLLSENLDVRYSLAARLIARLTGAARRCCINMSENDLMPIRGADATYDTAGILLTTRVEEDLRFGITNVIDRLRSQLQPEPLVSRGEAMTAFFKGNKYYRKPGMRMTEFVSLFEEGLERLRVESVDVKALEPTLGWFFLQHACLTPERRERALTALPAGGDYTLEDAKKVCLRLFADIHLSENRFTSAPRGQFTPGGRRQVNTLADTPGNSSGHQPDEHYDVDEQWEEEEGEEEGEEMDVHEVVREELQCLAGDLASSRVQLTQEDEEKVETAAAQLAGVQEALEIVRDIRRKVNPGAVAVSPHRSKGKGKGRGKGKGKGRGK